MSGSRPDGWWLEYPEGRFHLEFARALAEAYGATDPYAVAEESMREFSEREIDADVAREVAAFIRERSQ